MTFTIHLLLLRPQFPLVAGAWRTLTMEWQVFPALYSRRPTAVMINTEEQGLYSSPSDPVVLGWRNRPDTWNNVNKGITILSAPDSTNQFSASTYKRFTFLVVPQIAITGSGTKPTHL